MEAGREVRGTHVVLAGGLVSVVATTDYYVLGPLDEGSFVKYAEVGWSASGITSLSVGCGWSGDDVAAAGAFGRSVSVIKAAEGTVGGKPAAVFYMGAAGNGIYRIPIFQPVRSGRNRLMFGFASAQAGIIGAFNASVWVRS